MEQIKSIEQVLKLIDKKQIRIFNGEDKTTDKTFVSFYAKDIIDNELTESVKKLHLSKIVDKGLIGVYVIVYQFTEKNKAHVLFTDVLLLNNDLSLQYANEIREITKDFTISTSSDSDTLLPGAKGNEFKLDSGETIIFDIPIYDEIFKKESKKSDKMENKETLKIKEIESLIKNSNEDFYGFELEETYNDTILSLLNKKSKESILISESLKNNNIVININVNDDNVRSINVKYNKETFISELRQFINTTDEYLITIKKVNKLEEKLKSFNYEGFKFLSNGEYYIVLKRKEDSYVILVSPDDFSLSNDDNEINFDYGAPILDVENIYEESKKYINHLIRKDIIDEYKKFESKSNANKSSNKTQELQYQIIRSSIINKISTDMFQFDTDTLLDAMQNLLQQFDESFESTYKWDSENEQYILS